MFSGQSGRKVIIIVFVVVLAAWSLFQFYYFVKHGEEFFPAVIKHMIQSPREEVREEDDTESLLRMKLTVNPNYDGSNEEYIYSDSTDEDAVVRICQTVTYQYYDDKGSAIKTTETQSYDAHGEILFSGYRRGRCKMADTSITRQEIEILYSYGRGKIHRDYTITSYADEVCLDSVSESSKINRT